MTTSANDRRDLGPPAGSSDGADSIGHLRGLDAIPAFAELSRIDLAANDLSGVLHRVAALAQAAIAGAAEVSVTLVLAGVPSTAAHVGDVSLALDERQYDTGYGPCLDAARDQEVYLIRDTTLEERWPAFTAAARQHGVHSTLSVGIPIRDTVTGGLNIYALAPDAFDDDAVAIGRAFAGYAAVALANAHLYETTAALAAQMAEAMSSRAVIEQAKGVLIAQQKITSDEAFNILSRASQSANRKLRDIAQAIVEGAANSS